MLKGSDIHVKGHNKLSPKNYGPFPIQKQLGPVTFLLKFPASYKIHPVFHASKLIKFNKDEISNRNPTRPGPIEIEGPDVYEVEAILDTRLHYGKVQYEVKWQGYPSSENTWEYPDNVEGSSRLVKQFHKDHPNALEPKSKKDWRPKNK